MENRFLCRGKREHIDAWVYGLPSYKDGEIKEIEEYSRYDLRFHTIIPGTFCQCTGRTDRDGTFIFEHDVIAYLDTYRAESGYTEADCVGEVVWDEETLSFQVTNKLSAESWEVLDGECKVLGNTIDNPELLEV